METRGLKRDWEHSESGCVKEQQEDGEDERDRKWNCVGERLKANEKQSMVMRRAWGSLQSPPGLGRLKEEWSAATEQPLISL